MNDWVTTFDLLNGYNGNPPISTQTQNNLRKNKKIQYLKIGRNIFYKKAWVDDYINSTISAVDIPLARKTHANN
jgi:hypothetical protein